MTLSAISHVNYSNLSLTQNDCQLQAIEIFGKELAESLKTRDGSWEKVIESWNISLAAWKIIKESENSLHKLPELIYCETQVSDGLIFTLLKSWNNEKQQYDQEITEGELTTPHGFMRLKFENTRSMEEFMTRLEKKFFKKQSNSSIDSPLDEKVYSFTLDPNKVATYKPSYYFDKCGCALQEEFGETEYSRTQALSIYKLLSQHTGITIKGQPIFANIC